MALLRFVETTTHGLRAPDAAQRAALAAWCAAEPGPSVWHNGSRLSGAARKSAAPRSGHETPVSSKRVGQRPVRTTNKNDAWSRYSPHLCSCYFPVLTGTTGAAATVVRSRAFPDRRECPAFPARFRRVVTYSPRLLPPVAKAPSIPLGLLTKNIKARIRIDSPGPVSFILEHIMNKWAGRGFTWTANTFRRSGA